MSCTQKEVPIPFNKPFIVGKELFYIAQAVMGGQLSGNGPFTKRCQELLKLKLGGRKVLLTQSCTDALEMAAILCGLEPGDEVLMPSFTFVSTANAFVLRGAIPVFVDIRRDTLNLDEKLLEAAIGPKTKAIVPVHYAGLGCEMDAIMTIARKHNLLVVEDAAQAMLSSYRGKMLGTIGDLGCFSFHETKNIISGEGGALFVNNPELAERAEIIWEKGTNRSQFYRGQVDKYTWVDIGSSFLPSELTAAFLFSQLESAEKIISRRRRLVERYLDGFALLQDSGSIVLPSRKILDDANGHLFYILLDSADTRGRVIDELKQNGILSVFHYIPLHSSPAGIRFGKTSGAMTVTDEVSHRLLRLPLYYEMTDEDQDRVIESVHQCFL